MDDILARIVFDTNGVGAPTVRSTDGKVTVARTGVGVFTLTRDTDAGVGAFDTNRDYCKLDMVLVDAPTVLACVTSITADVITITVRTLAAGGGGAATETTGNKITATVRRAARLAT